MPDSDIRTLLESDDPWQWKLALQMPGVTPEDLDFVLGRLQGRSIYYNKDGDRLDWLFPPSFFKQLHSSPEHISKLLALRDDEGKLFYKDNRIVSEILELPLREEHVDQLLGDLTPWMKAYTNFVNELVNRDSFKSRHLDRLLDFATEYGGDAVPTTRLKLNEATSDDIDRWVGWGLEHYRNSGRGLMDQLALHSKLSDAAFRNILNSDHPVRYEMSKRQMSDSQLKAILSDPKMSDPSSRDFGWGSEVQSKALANQVNVSEENLELAARHHSPQVRREAAANSSVTEGILRRLVRDMDEQVRSRVVRNLNVTPELLDEAAQEELAGPRGRWGVLNHIAENPRTSAETLGRLIHPPMEAGDNFRKHFRILASKHPNLTQEQLGQILMDPDGPTVQSIFYYAHNRITPEQMRATFMSPALKGFHLEGVQSAILLDSRLWRHLGPDELRFLDAKAQEGRQIGYGVRASLLAHPALPQDILERHLTSDDWTAREQAVQNPQVTAERLDALLADPQAYSHAGFIDGALANPNVQLRHLEQVHGYFKFYSIDQTLINHPKATPEFLRLIWQRHKAERHLDDSNLMLLLDSKIPGDVAEDMAQDELLEPNIRSKALEHPDISDKLLQEFIAKGDQAREETFGVWGPSVKAWAIYEQRHPDAVFAKEGHPQVQARLGVGRLRKIRDLIWKKSPEQGEARPKDLPPGDWSAGRNERGNISAQKLQAVIDAVEPVTFNVSHSSWKGAQRHTGQPSEVFQANLTDGHVRKMRETGVFPTFLRIMHASEQSSHPVRPGQTVGWVRYTKGEDGVHIDEIQSDFGRSLEQIAREQAAAAGEDVEEVGRRAAQQYPDAHFKVISHILFGGKHANEVVGEAFVQHLRDAGHASLPIAIHDVKTKAPLSGLDTNRPLPGHLMFTYQELPKRMGMERSVYGKISTQSNPNLKEKGTWEAPVRKREQK